MIDDTSKEHFLIIRLIFAKYSILIILLSKKRQTVYDRGEYLLRCQKHNFLCLAREDLEIIFIQNSFELSKAFDFYRNEYNRGA